MRRGIARQTKLVDEALALCERLQDLWFYELGLLPPLATCSENEQYRRITHALNRSEGRAHRRAMYLRVLERGVGK